MFATSKHAHATSVGRMRITAPTRNVCNKAVCSTGKWGFVMLGVDWCCAFVIAQMLADWSLGMCGQRNGVGLLRFHIDVSGHWHLCFPTERISHIFANGDFDNHCVNRAMQSSGTTHYLSHLPTSAASARQHWFWFAWRLRSKYCCARVVCWVSLRF